MDPETVANEVDEFNDGKRFIFMLEALKGEFRKYVFHCPKFNGCAAAAFELHIYV